MRPIDEAASQAHPLRVFYEQRVHPQDEKEQQEGREERKCHARKFGVNRQAMA